ncbi:hybrid sensor histidine kinase/response regulator transcription factor [Aliiglaciecola sp. M165]|uniref:hybrid sensor histidine kinase/response regulator transcription factor n=1 Tax=Aliiglaciecola sp. M165 TaxID=2593649 RepID=UPI00117DDFDA|nr:hybrid sensor histidine kinase/response regulator transcription factor [Aliiglaciecola sp. M165]TRY33013.1 response regulator [Aliiglaciecola sp. M165]
MNSIYRFVGNIIIFVLLLSNSLIQSLQASQLHHVKTPGSQYIESLFQDSRGFFWIGTQDGVFKYDGVNFEDYSTNENPNKRLPGKWIFDIAEDKMGNVWIATNASLGKYDFKTDKFKIFSSNKLFKAKGTTGYPKTLFLDKEFTFWVGTTHGLFEYLPDEDDFSLKEHDGFETTPEILSIEDGTEETLWVGTRRDKLAKYDKKTGLLQNHSIRVIGNSEPLSIGTNKQILVKNVLFSRFAGHIAYQQEGESELTVLLESKDAPDMYYLGDNRLLVVANGTEFEYQLFFSTSGNLEDIKLIRQKNLRLIRYVSTLAKTADNTLWYGSNDGLYKRNLSYEGLLTVNIDHDIRDFEVINAIAYANESSIYVASRHKLYKYSIETDQLTALEGLNCFENDTPFLTALLFENQNRLWIGTQQDGLCLHDPINKSSRLFTKQTGLFSNAVAKLVLNENNQLLIGSMFAGISVYDSHNDSFHLISGISGDSQVLTSKFPVGIALDSSGIMWVAHYQKGADRVDIESMQVTNFIHSDEDKDSLSGNKTSFTKIDSRGNLWIGTFGSGLNYLNEEEKRNKNFKFKHINTSTGLSSDSIYDLQEDQSGVIWVSTANGISKLSQNGEVLDIFGKEHGLQGTEFQHNSSYIDPTGRLYFGGVNGFNAFYPEDLKKNNYIPPIQLTNFLRLNQTTPLSDVENANGAIQLNHKDYFFAFEYAAMDFTAPEKNQYRYKLEGFDENWIEAGNDNRATYTNVPAGNYQFRVQGSNNDGVWNREGLTVPMTILPPLWKTWWAYTIYLILSITLLAWILTFRTRQLQKVNVTLEKAVYERTTELQRQTEALNKSNQQIRGLLEQQKTLFANVSHEFRTPLTLIISPLQKLATEIKDPKSGRMMELIYRNAKRLNRMVDQILELAKLETDQEIQYKSYDARKSLQEIVESFKPLVDLRSQTLTLDVKGDASMELIKDSFEKILSNLISNAVKYCPFGANIDITCKIKNQQVEINVIDNGPGISSELLPRIFERFVRVENDDNIVGSGLGLAYVKELVEANNGGIAVASEIGHGTQFTLKLPASLTAANTLSDGISTPILYQFSPLTDAKFNPTEIPEDSTAENTILVVEDNPEMREFIVECLASVGQCLVAPDGAKGLEIATEMLPDLIITDLMMPKLNGHELVAAIRENDITAHIPVVMLTAKGDDQSRIQGLKLNVDDYMSKPFSTEELQIRVTRLLSIRKMIQRRFGRNALDALVLATNEEGKDTQKINVEFDNERDRVFYDNFVQVVEEHYQDDDFSRALAAQKLFVSERQLNRKLSALIDYNFTDYLRKYRLEKAKKLLSKGIAVGDVSYQVGFSSQSYFSTCFKAEFGVTPSAFIEH